MKRSQKPVWNGCRLWLLASLLWGGVVFSGQAADWYVATNGTHTTGADWSAAFTNVQAALDVAGANDTIYLAGHTFVATQIAWSVSSVTILGGYEADPGREPGEYDSLKWRTILTVPPGMESRVMRIADVTNGTLRRVDIRDGQIAANGAGLHISDSEDLVISDCRIVNNDSTPSSYGGGLYAFNTSGVLSNSIIAANVAYAHTDGRGMGGYIEGGNWNFFDVSWVANRAQENWGYLKGAGLHLNGGTHVLRNVLVAQNFNLKLHNHSKMLGGGIYVASATDVTIENATIVRNSEHGLYSESPNVTVRNSILYGNFWDIAGTVPALTNNCISDGTADGVNGNFSDDPLFEGPLFYVATNSPVLNAGDGSVAAAGLTGYTSLTNGTADSGTVNLGYHFQAGTGVELELYVDPVAGSDANSGLSAGAPLRSITRALELAGARTRVQLASGRYTNGVERFPLRIDGRSVQLIGTHRTATVIDGTGAEARLLEMTETLGDNRIENLTLTGADVATSTSLGNGAAVEPHGAGLYTRSSVLTLKNCSITRNTNQRAVDRSTTFGGGLYSLGGSGIMMDTVVSGNRTTAHSNGKGAGIYLEGGAWTLRDSTVLANRMVNTGWGRGRGAGLYVYAGRHVLRNVLVLGNDVVVYNSSYCQGGGIYATGPGTVLNIENATILGNSEHGVYATTPNVKVRNSIIYRNVWDIGGTPTLLNNCIGDGTSDGVDGNFAEDPLLRSPLFYLQEESPAIDAGDRTVENAGLSGYTSLGDGTPDSGMVNLGYHYATGLGIDAEVYVDPDTGLDTNDGLSWTTPFQSISRALEHPADRLRIHLAEGTYTAANEQFPLAVDGRAVQLVGVDRDSTIIDATGADARALEVMNSLGDNRVEGVTLTGAYVDADGAGIHAWGSVLTVSDSRVSGNRAGIWNHCGGIFADGSIGLVRDSIIQDNQMGSAHQNYGAGFYGLGGSWQVVNSVVSGNEGLPGGWNNTHGAGLNFSYGAHLLRNTLVSGNRVAKIGNGVGGIRVVGSCSLAIESTTVVDNDPAGIHRSNGRVTARNVVLFRNGTEYAGTIDLQYSCSSNLTHGVDGNITNAPLFVAEDDYHMLSSSPTLNAGLLQDWMAGATDLDGNKRVSMGTVDMGCYELPAPAGTVFMIR